jgi:hypothetical protein
MHQSTCLNCNSKFVLKRKSQKYCKRLCSLQHRYKVNKSSQYSIEWRLESLKKKLDKFDEDRIKKLFKKSKKEILADGYSPEINKKLTKLIGFDKWRKSEKGKETLKKYLNKDEVKEKIKKYFSRPDVKILRNEKRRAYDQTEKGQQVRKKKYLNQKSKPDFRKKRNKYYTDRVKSDPVFKMRMRLSSYVLKSLKKQNAVKSKKFHTLLGCTVSELKTFLEKKFKPGMSWKNHGLNGWHIDHIKPVTKFNLIDPEEQKKCFHYTNLQPLWATENIKKSNKY